MKRTGKRFRSVCILLASACFLVALLAAIKLFAPTHIEAQQTPERLWGRIYLGLLDATGNNVSPISASNPLPTSIAEPIEVSSVASITEPVAVSNLYFVDEAPAEDALGAIVRVAGAISSIEAITEPVSTPETCIPNLALDAVCSASCNATGSTTFTLPSGIYEMIVFNTDDSEVFLKQGASTVNTGGFPYAKGARRTVVIEEESTMSCRSASEAGSACFGRCL